MKINEVDKVTTLAAGECITAIAADKSLIQIPVSELAKVMAQVMPVATSEKNGAMGSSLFQLLKIRNIPYTLSRNQCAKIGRLINTGSRSSRFTMLLTGSSHYGIPATYIVEFGVYEGGIYSIFCSQKTSQLIDEYYGEIIIFGNEIYMCTSNYVDNFKIFVLEYNDCEFHNVAENAAKPVGGISSRDTIHSIINT